MHLVIGTRGSALARTQTEWVAARLRHLGHAVEIVVIATRGDREQDRPVPELGGKGLFTAELEQALRDGTIHIAVHSLKDLPVENPPGLCLGAIPVREDWRDVLVTQGQVTLDQLPMGARVGTASLRRRALIAALRPDLVMLPLRGNVDTRLQKALSGELDGVVLAAAGLRRLGHAAHATVALPILPAPGQGALGIQAAESSGPVLDALGLLHHRPTATAVIAERALLLDLGGGCSTPVGAHAELDGSSCRLRAVVASLDGKRVLRAEAVGEDPVALGRAVAGGLRRQGAQELLDGNA
jgi:hydroxymethylbilane synthase